MKRKAIILGALAVAVILVTWLRGCFLSEAERIERLIRSMGDGFNRSRAGQVVGPLAEDYIEETTRHDRTDVRGFLGLLFLTQRDPKTKDLRLRVETESVSVAIDPESEDRARATVVATFQTLGPGGYEPAWKVEVSASLERTGDGWKVVRSSHRGLGGKRPF